MTTLHDLAHAYLLDLRARNLSPNYLALHERTLHETTTYLGDMEIADLTADQFRFLLVHLRGEIPQTAPPGLQRARRPALGAASVDIHYRNLKTLFNWAEEEELLSPNPMRRVKRPRVPKRLPRALSEAEVSRLLTGVRSNGDHNAFRDYCLLLFFLDTGVRLSELATLPLDNVNLEQGWARVTGKGRKERLVPLGLALRRELSKWLIKRWAHIGERALFVNQFGWALGTRGIQSIVKRDLTRYCPDLPADRGPHTLRHTFATMNLRRTHDLKTTSLILGHTSTQTTERYTHLVGADVLANHADGSALDNLLQAR